MGKAKLAVLITLGIMWGILTYGLDWLFKDPSMVYNIFGTSYTLIGIMLAVTAFINAVVMLPSGRIADKLGRKLVVIVSFLGLAVCYFAYTFALSFEPLFVLYIVGSIRMVFAATAWVALLAWIADNSSEKNRGTIMSTLNAALTMANIAALGVIGLMYQYTNPYTTFTLVAAVQLIALIPILFISQRSGADQDSQGKGAKPVKGAKMRTWKEVIRDRPLVFLSISALFATAPGLLIQFIILPLLSSPEYGFNMVESTIPLGVMLLFTLVGFGIAAVVMDKFRIKRGLLIGSLVASEIPLFLLFLTPYLVFMQNIIALVIFFGLIGLGMGTSMPTYMAVMADLAPSGEMGTEMGVFQGILNFNYVIGNSFGGYLWDLGGLSLTMLGGVLLVIIALVLVVGAVRRSAFETREQKSEHK
nr:MFS transporter [Candidatus Njordarchaeota archaeon]